MLPEMHDLTSLEEANQRENLYSIIAFITSCFSARYLNLITVVLVLENEPEPRLACMEVENSLVSLLQRNGLCPRLDVLLRNKLQHLFDLPRRSDGRTGDVDGLSDQRESLESGEWVLGGSDLAEGTAESEQVEVAGQGHLVGGNGRNDEVERRGVLALLPVFFRSSNEAVSAERLSVLLFSAGARDNGDALCAESLCE